MNIIEIKNIKKSYGKDFKLDIESFKLRRKQIYGLIGPNGTGKTTTMKIILGLIKADAGSVFIKEKEMNKKNRVSILRSIGSMIEGPSYYKHLSAISNMDIVSAMKNIDKKKGLEALEIVGLKNHSKKKVSQYSLGMKQRLGIAMAIVGNPEILILDEPTNGLDPYGMEEIRELIKNLAEELDISIIISSHILDEVEKIVTDIAIMSDGNLIFDGSLKSLKETIPSNIIINTSDNVKALDLLNLSRKNLNERGFYISKNDNEYIYSIVNLLIKNNIGINRIFEEDKSLEELFINLTEKGKL